MMKGREKGFIRAGLKGPGLARRRGVESRIIIFERLICNIDVPKNRLIMHFSDKHPDILKTIQSLIRAWGLIEGSAPEAPEISMEKRYSCSICGKSYNHRQNLARHRRLSTHYAEKISPLIFPFQN